MRHRRGARSPTISEIEAGLGEHGVRLTPKERELLRLNFQAISGWTDVEITRTYCVALLSLAYAYPDIQERAAEADPLAAEVYHILCEKNTKLSVALLVVASILIQQVQEFEDETSTPSNLLH